MHAEVVVQDDRLFFKQFGLQEGEKLQCVNVVGARPLSGNDEFRIGSLKFLAG